MVSILILVLMLITLGFGFYVFMLYFPGDPVVLEEFSSSDEIFSPPSKTQFYPNMRYRFKVVKYNVESICNVKKKSDVIEAFSILGEKTALSFVLDEKNPEIEILCSEVAPAPEEESHFVAGEGGPSQVINASAFNVIYSGKVSLFRTDKCDKPQIATHEILHALGFDHNENPRSVMYSITNCNQKIDDYIIEEINRLYSVPSLPDLVIEKVSAEKIGRYLDFQLTVANYGLDDSGNSTLIVSADGEEAGRFAIGGIEIGTRRVVTVENVRVPRKFNQVVFEAELDEVEISKENNKANVNVLE